MKPLTYTLANPAGNITVLVETPVPVCAQPKAAAFLMKMEPSAEQVGFVTNTALRMAGGEFCGNATASAAALYCRKNGLQTADLSVTVCGLDYPVSVALQGEHYNTCITLPLPKKITAEHLAFGSAKFEFPCVWMDGIAHLILTQPMERSVAEQAIRKWASELQVDALGMMFLSRENTRLTPLVFVPGANTLYWENSCASGTAAVGAFFFASGQTDKVILEQPNGVLQAKTADDRICLSGTVILEQPRTVLWEEAF